MARHGSDGRYDGRNLELNKPEPDDAYYLCEPKAERDVEDEVVQAKVRAAAKWCQHASTVASKPWSYLLIPHTAVDESPSLAGLAAQFTVEAE